MSAKCRRKGGVRIGIGCLLLLAALLVGSPAALAAPADPVDEPPCTDCHALETQTWQHSSHAAVDPTTGTAVARCVDCHGAYSEEHPEDNLMALDVSSLTCATCHSATYTQWSATIHAQNEVQCIGCHQAHSQDLRLSGQTLCTGCHAEPREDPFHEAHWLGEAACVDCHMAGEAMPMEVAGETNQLMAFAIGSTSFLQPSRILPPNAAEHDFVTVSTGRCLDCHREDVRNPENGGQSIEDRLLASKQTSTQLASSLEITRRNLHTSEGLLPVALGVGLGLGGFLGIAFMLAAARIDPASRKGDEAAFRESEE
jgi:hypothetical protein